ncbi:MAG: uroporphyrinogen-III synthase, partial [Janthinobacterium lividum]
MKSIWLTRSLAQNLQLEEQLKVYNFRFINHPLITYTDDNEVFSSDIFSKYTNIVVTSKHAAARIANSCSAPENNEYICAWVVGSNSANILRNAGFQVKFAAMNVKHLLVNLPKLIYSNTVYLSGNIITQRLPIEIERLVIYN